MFLLLLDILMFYDVFEEMFVVFNFNVYFVPCDFNVYTIVLEKMLVVINFNVFLNIF